MAVSTTSFDQQYALRGLNMVTPDQLIDDKASTAGQSPFATDFRIFLPTDTSEPRTSVQSRQGASFYSIPIGETLDTQFTTTTGQNDANVSYVNNVAQLWTPGTNNALTAIDLLIKSTGSSDTITVNIYTNVSGAIGSLIASSSIAASSITTSYVYVKARFAQAPVLSTSSSYWIVLSAQEETITANYAWSKSTSGSGAMTSPDGGSTWTATTGELNFKTYLSTPGSVKGQIRWINKNGIKQSIFAFGTGIYYVSNESTGVTTQIASGLSSTATRYRFETVYDKCYIVNGVDPLMIWDGTTMTTVPNVGGLANPANMVVYHDRAWYYNNSDPTRLYFSNLYPDLTTIPVVNFQYVPDTASPDPLTGFSKFQDQLVLFTKDSKYLLLGDNVSTLGLSQSPGGTKGAVSQEAISQGEKYVYFWSIDGGPYYYDGAQDHQLGDDIQPISDTITSLSDMDTIVTEKEFRIYFKANGDVMHRYMLLYDLRYNEWMYDTETYTRLPIAQVLETNTLVEASSTVGALYFGENQDNHLGAPIHFKYWTNYKKYTSGIAKDRIKTFRAIFESPDRTIDVRVGKDGDFDNNPNMKIVTLNSSGILYNGGETYGDTTAVYGRGSRISNPQISMSGRSLNTQYRFEKDVLNTPIRLYGYEAIISSGRPR